MKTQIGKWRQLSHETEERYQKMFTALWAVIMLCVSVFGFMQTEFFISLTAPPSREELILHIEKSRALQHELSAEFSARTGKELPRGLIVSELFSTDEREIIHRELDNLMRDYDVNKILSRGFNITLDDATAIILPGSRIHSHEDFTMYGLTRHASERWLTLSNEPNLQGITLRDRPDDTPLTVDGVPRIILFRTAFANRATLRLTLFHQLLHALNIPGYRPLPGIILQDDLKYLPEYRHILRTGGFPRRTEFYIWCFGVVLPLLILSFTLWRLIRLRKTHKLPEDGRGIE